MSASCRIGLQRTDEIQFGNADWADAADPADVRRRDAGPEGAPSERKEPVRSLLLTTRANRVLLFDMPCDGARRLAQSRIKIRQIREIRQIRASKLDFFS